MRECPQVSDDRIAELADIMERKTGKRLSMEEAREAGETLIRFVLLLDREDRRIKAEAAEQAQRPL